MLNNVMMPKKSYNLYSNLLFTNQFHWKRKKYDYGFLSLQRDKKYGPVFYFYSVTFFVAGPVLNNMSYKLF